MLAWLSFIVSLDMGKSASVPYSLGNHAQLGGGNIVEIFRSMLAYGWVERCSDVAGYEMSSS